MYLPKYFAGPLNQLTGYLREELEAFRLYLLEGNEKIVQIAVSHVEPDKPRAGMVVYADGTDWEPDGAGGEGFYGYYDGAWHKLG